MLKEAEEKGKGDVAATGLHVPLIVFHKGTIPVYYCNTSAGICANRDLVLHMKEVFIIPCPCLSVSCYSRSILQPYTNS